MENGWFSLHSKFPIFPKIPGLFPKVLGFFPAFKNCGFFATLVWIFLRPSKIIVLCKDISMVIYEVAVLVKIELKKHKKKLRTKKWNCWFENTCLFSLFHIQKSLSSTFWVPLHDYNIRANPPEFFRRLLTTIY